MWQQKALRALQSWPPGLLRGVGCEASSDRLNCQGGGGGRKAGFVAIAIATKTTAAGRGQICHRQQAHSTSDGYGEDLAGRTLPPPVVRYSRPIATPILFFVNGFALLFCSAAEPQHGLGRNEAK